MEGHVDENVSVSMEQLEDAVKTLYKSLEELDELKAMADNYM
jgi:hypothetical protein